MTATATGRAWVFASGNAGKLAEARALLAACDIELTPQSAFGIAPAAETGLTFVENALSKARHAATASGLPAIADDSGLCVDALGGAPGLHSARFAGNGARDADNVAKLLTALADVPEAERAAHFVCVVVALRSCDDPDPLIATGHWHGVITTEPRGRGGFGYDPVFYVPSAGCTAAELTPRAKDGLSHRALAFRALRARLPAASST